MYESYYIYIFRFAYWQFIVRILRECKYDYIFAQALKMQMPILHINVLVIIFSGRIATDFHFVLITLIITWQWAI